MTHQQETQPKLGSRDCLTVGAASAMLELRRTSGCEFTTCTTKVQLPNDGANTRQLIALRGRLGHGRVTSALPKKANWIGGLPLHSIEPFDAGAGQNRSSGHEGEGPPARKAKGYGQWRWVGQRPENRIGVPKASNDRVLTIRGFDMSPRWVERAEEDLENQLADGLIDQKEYNEGIREIQRELRGYAEEQAEEAYRDAYGGG